MTGMCCLVHLYFWLPEQRQECENHHHTCRGAFTPLFWRCSEKQSTGRLSLWRRSQSVNTSPCQNLLFVQLCHQTQCNFEYEKLGTSKSADVSDTFEGSAQHLWRSLWRFFIRATAVFFFFLLRGNNHHGCSCSLNKGKLLWEHVPKIQPIFPPFLPTKWTESGRKKNSASYSPTGRLHHTDFIMGLKSVGDMLPLKLVWFPCPLESEDRQHP